MEWAESSTNEHDITGWNVKASSATFPSPGIGTPVPQVGTSSEPLGYSCSTKQLLVEANSIILERMDIDVTQDTGATVEVR